LVLLDTGRASSARAERVGALLAPAGITAVSGGDGDLPSPVAVVCGSPDAAEDAVRAAVDGVRARGAVTVVVAAGDPTAAVPGAEERITDNMDTLAFGSRMLDALGVAR
jgi:hypothetical protein